MQEFLESVARYEVPQYLPSGYRCHDPFFIDGKEVYPRGFCTERGMWAIVTMSWTAELANQLRPLKVLEIMAGAGWLAKALTDHGIAITTTDDYSWDASNHKEMRRLLPIMKMDALEAVDELGPEHDVLLCSWPPLGGSKFTECCQMWGTKPIVYIGEGEHGCTANDEFFGGFEIFHEVYMPRWHGLYDHCQIGTWEKR